MARYRGRHRRPARHHLAAARAAVIGAGALAGVATSTIEATAGPDGGWGPIIACESGGVSTATNASSTASGLFQFIDGTWRAYGGGQFAQRAKDATVGQQTIVAERAYTAEGLRPWASSRPCWADSAAAQPAAVRSTPVPTSSTTSWGNGGYTVRAGDTLSSIAAAHRSSWRAIWSANAAVIGADPDFIQPGQTLHV